MPNNEMKPAASYGETYDEDVHDEDTLIDSSYSQSYVDDKETEAVPMLHSLPSPGFRERFANIGSRKLSLICGILGLLVVVIFVGTTTGLLVVVIITD